MDYKAEWTTLRNELYAELKHTKYPNQGYLDVLMLMIDAEDRASGIDIAERHRHELGHAEVIALYEARER